MAFNRNKVSAPVAEPPAAAAPAVETPAPAPAVDYPTIPPPEAHVEDNVLDHLRSLHSSSDKDLRMMYAGIYQALSQSQALYAARNIMDVSQWHAAIEEEVDYFVGRVLARSQKE